ncbi:MAG TPA: BMP family ABC transporter substrate-binding protein [Polyangiaceae bacterium]|jgi:basic membrane protein A
MVHSTVEGRRAEKGAMGMGPRGPVRFLVGLAGLAVCGCSESGGSRPDGGVTGGSNGTVCLVSDTAGLDDDGFNHSALLGLEQVEESGWNTFAVESRTADDYAPNVQSFLGGKCDLIVAVGFDLQAATVAAAQANPLQRFLILDTSLGDALSKQAQRVWAQSYDTCRAAFLAGYVAAATSRTKVLATFGGQQIPPVTDFMTGFVAGAHYYAGQSDGGAVVVLGWDPVADAGTFAEGGFVDPVEGRTLADGFLAQGADVLFPVAGATGFGAGDAIVVSGRSSYLVGVDTDWSVAAPQYKDFVLTSVVKRLDRSVVSVVGQLGAGSFGGDHFSTLQADGGEVDIAPFQLSVVSSKTREDVQSLRAVILGGGLTSDLEGCPSGPR